MALKRLILVLSLLVVVTLIAGALIYHTTVYFSRLSAARESARGGLELATQRLTNEMLDWQRFGGALLITLPGVDPAEPGTPTARLQRLVADTYGLRGIELISASESQWQVGSTIEAASMTCGGAEGRQSLVSTAPGGANPGLVHCLPIGEAERASAILVLNTMLDTLNYELPAGPLLSIVLVDTNGRLLAGGQLHAVDRYPVGEDGAPRTGSVELGGEEYEAASLPVAGLEGAHLVALTSHKTIWSRALEPQLAPAGVVYLLMAAALAVLVRRLYLAAGREVERRENIAQKLSRSEAKYRELSISDSLTGLYNRRKFHADLHHELSRNRRYEHPFSLAVMDVDHFKRVNDHYGHNEGDRALRLLGRVLRGTRRKADTAYRVGGEEFVLMLPETTGADAVTAVRRIQAELGKTRLYTEEGDEVVVTVSVGIAEFDGEETDRELFNRADAAMYSVKQRGRGGLAMAEAPPPSPAASRSELS